MNNYGWVWTRPALRVACRVVEQLPASIADRLYVSTSPTGDVDLQVPGRVPLVERIACIEQIAAQLDVTPVWEEYPTSPGVWYFGTRHVVVDGIGVRAFISTDTEELTPVRPELAGVAG
jgi:hypothetical protein